MNISRHSLIFGLSYALDIANKNNFSHSKNTAYLSVLIGREVGLDKNMVLNLYYAALLHDIALSKTYQMIPHCIDGEKIIKTLPLPEIIASDVYYHHEFCDGSGLFGVSGGHIPLGAQIICFASAFDDLFGSSADEFDRNLFLTVCDWFDKHRTLFYNCITIAFEKLIKQEAFLLDYFNLETKYVMSSNLIVGDDIYYDYDDVVKYAQCFAKIIDRRSPFTYNHSQGIANLARKAAVYLGYGSETQDIMYIAGLLHDIGKLHVSTDILHKEGKLTPDERFEINKHTYFTRKILEEIDGFQDITEYASNHHEKIDGTGYPYRIPGEKMGELERIIAICDVYQALTEERPYREGLSVDKAWCIIDEMAENLHLDKSLVMKVKQAF